MRRILLVTGLVILAACASARVKEQRVTQGPMAEDLWMTGVILANGREPNFDERRYWTNQLELKISQYLHQHPEVRDEGNRFERWESLRDLLPWIRGSKLSPDPLGPILGTDHAAHPLTPLATCFGLHEAQRVLERAADAAKITYPGEKAIIDVIDPARERTERSSEHLSH